MDGCDPPLYLPSQKVASEIELSADLTYYFGLFMEVEDEGGTSWSCECHVTPVTNSGGLVCSIFSIRLGTREL